MSAVTRLVCPHCSRAASTSKPLKNGVKVKCPGCGGVFAYTDAGPAVPKVVPPIPQASSPTAPPRPVAPAQTVHVVPEPAPGNALAIASLVLGILAALVCWVPFVGLLSLPFGALGVILGVAGLLVAVLGKRSGLATSLVSVGISIGAVALSVTITTSATRAIGEGIRTAAAKGRADDLARARIAAERETREAKAPESKAPTEAAVAPPVAPKAEVPVVEATKPALPSAVSLPKWVTAFLEEHTEFGKPTDRKDMPNWAKGRRERVSFDSGRSLLFYEKDGQVVTVYEGREIVWGDYDH